MICNDFDVLYYASSCGYEQKQSEIGIMEGEFIRKYRPILNTQIPKADDWRKWDNKKVDAGEILKDLL